MRECWWKQWQLLGLLLVFVPGQGRWAHFRSGGRRALRALRIGCDSLILRIRETRALPDRVHINRATPSTNAGKVEATWEASLCPISYDQPLREASRGFIRVSANASNALSLTQSPDITRSPGCGADALPLVRKARCGG